MNTAKHRDPLLIAAKGIVWFFTIILSLVTVVILAGIPAAVIFQDQLMAEILKEGVTAGKEVIGAILLLLAGMAALLALAVYFLVLLRRIIDSVGQGDPFAPENGERLSRMGWIALVTQFVTIPVGGMALWLEEVIGDADSSIHVDGDFGLSVEGILLTLILFILARVFRHGTALRDDLEGTV